MLTNNSCCTSNLMVSKLTDNEMCFIEQSRLFIEILARRYGFDNIQSLEPISEKSPIPLEPILILDYQSISESERNALSAQFNSELGVTSYIVQNAHKADMATHPIIVIASQLQKELGLQYPMTQDLETHPDTIARFGRSDQTTKIYRKPGSGGAMSGEDMMFHQDGLGNGGHVSAVGLYMDSAPLFGGYTYFFNVARLLLDLAQCDPEAFQSLFLPNALTIFRSSGSRALKLTGPILYVTDDDEPAVFFRQTGAEYQVTWRSDYTPLQRAKRFIDSRTRPFSYGSTFIHLTAPGHGCFWNNRLLVHGRTAYAQARVATEDRVLARKFWVSAPEHQIYKHYPALAIKKQYASLFPELFGDDLQMGEWRYDRVAGKNIRLK